MESLQVHNYGCRELDATTTREVNGGFLSLGINNVNGKITIGGQLDTNALLSLAYPACPAPAAVFPALAVSATYSPLLRTY